MPITAETRPTPIPSRHPAGPRSAPAGVEAIARLLRLPTLGAEQFRRYGELLTVGDAPMDDLVAWMHTDAPPEAREMFERALEHGISQVADAPAPLREFFDAVETVPDWVDFDRIDLGAAALRSGGSDGLAIARDVALFGGYLFSGFNQTLLRTGANLGYGGAVNRGVDAVASSEFLIIANPDVVWVAAVGALYTAIADNDGKTPLASVARELGRLQLFDAPATWTLLVWDDLEARLTLSSDPPTPLAGDAIDAGTTGLYALQAPAGGLPPLFVRHQGVPLDREVGYVRLTVTWDGKEFKVERSPGTLAANDAGPPPAAAAAP